MTEGVLLGKALQRTEQGKISTEGCTFSQCSHGQIQHSPPLRQGGHAVPFISQSPASGEEDINSRILWATGQTVPQRRLAGVNH